MSSSQQLKCHTKHIGAQIHFQPLEIGYAPNTHAQINQSPVIKSPLQVNIVCTDLLTIKFVAPETFLYFQHKYYSNPFTN